MPYKGKGIFKLIGIVRVWKPADWKR